MVNLSKTKKKFLEHCQKTINDWVNINFLSTYLQLFFLNLSIRIIKYVMEIINYILLRFFDTHPDGAHFERIETGKHNKNTRINKL